MKKLKYVAVIAVLSICTACTKKVPAHTDAGLVIENGSATCRFYSKQEVDGLFTVTMTTSKMDYSTTGHNLLIEWTSEPGRTKDKYDFTITVDGAVSRKNVIYIGAPITLMEKPLKLSLEAVNL